MNIHEVGTKRNCTGMSGQQLVVVRSPLALYRHLLRRLAGSVPDDAFKYYRHRIRQAS